MTATPQRVVRLAWGIAILCLAGLVACLVLLALDLPAMDSVFTAQLPWLLNLVVTGVLGLLIATRLPRNPIGWLLLAISVGNVGSVLSDFIAVRGMLAGASPTSWVEWPTWVFSWSGGFGADLLAFLILLFPHGRLPSPRWRWAAW